MRNDDHHPTYTIDEFCAAERISRSKLYELSNERRGPALFPHRNAQAHHRTSAPRLAPTARGRSDGQHRRHADHADFEEWRQGMGWRDKYKMHPSAGVFPMMEGEELTNLVKDITEKGLKTPITVDKDGVLLDGRNRLQALELAGIELQSWQVQIYSGDDPVGYIISVNVHRRHLTKKQIADLIVAAYNAAVAKPPQDEAVFKGGVAKSIWSSKRPLPTPRNTASARARSSGH